MDLFWGDYSWSGCGVDSLRGTCEPLGELEPRMDANYAALDLRYASINADFFGGYEGLRKRNAQV